MAKRRGKRTWARGVGLSISPAALAVIDAEVAALNARRPRGTRPMSRSAYIVGAALGLAERAAKRRGRP